MPCYHPLSAYRSDSGEIVFSDRGGDPLSLPCGRCIGCRLERSRQWATRIMFESQFYDSNCFITLTYSEDQCPYPPSLDYSHFQKFMKRLRRKVGSLRFFCAGEYGDKFGRPHFHACIFGYDFPDRVFFKRSRSGNVYYRSQLLEDLWPFGYSSVANLEFDSAAYVARYCLKKVTGDDADVHYSFVDPQTGEVSYLEPELARMSLRPGIGARWFDKYWDTDLSRDYVVINGRRCKPPRYFDKLFEKLDPLAFDDIKQERAFLAAQRAQAAPDEQSYERLRYREDVVSRRLALLSPRGDL